MECTLFRYSFPELVKDFYNEEEKTVAYMKSQRVLPTAVN